MNESFGTYSDYLYHRYEKGDDEGAVNLQNKLTAYLREAKTRYIRPIVSDRYDKPGDMFDSHTYPKGALVLHMLRTILGRRAVLQDPEPLPPPLRLRRRSTPPTSSGPSRRSPARTSTGSSTSGSSSPAIPSSTSRSAVGRRPARSSSLTVAQVQDFTARHSGLPRPRRHRDRHGRAARSRPASGSGRRRRRSNSRPRPSRCSSASTRATSLIKEVTFPKDARRAALPAQPRRRDRPDGRGRQNCAVAADQPAVLTELARRAPGTIPSGRSAGPPSRLWPGDPPQRSPRPSRRPAGTRTRPSGPRRSRPLAPPRTSAWPLSTRTSSGRTEASVSGPRPFGPWV